MVTLHELGARILGLEAGDVRGDVVNLLVRFRGMISAVVVVRQSSLLTAVWHTLSGRRQALVSRS